MQLSLIEMAILLVGFSHLCESFCEITEEKSMITVKMIKTSNYSCETEIGLKRKL